MYVWKSRKLEGWWVTEFLVMCNSTLNIKERIPHPSNRWVGVTQISCFGRKVIKFHTIIDRG